MVRAQLRPLLDSNKNNCPLSTWEGPKLVREIEWEWAEIKAHRDAQRIVIQRKGEPSDWKAFKPLHRHQKKCKEKQNSDNEKNEILKLVNMFLLMLTLQLVMIVY